MASRKFLRLVLRGDFRVQIPAGDLRRDDATLGAFLEPEGHTILVGSADETIQSGADRHLFITIAGVLSPQPLTALPPYDEILSLEQAGMNDGGEGRRFFGEEVLPAPGPAVVIDRPLAAVESFSSPVATDWTVHHPSFWLASRVLRQALDLTWTGHELDFAGAHGIGVRTMGWGRTAVGPRVAIIRRSEAVRLHPAGLWLSWIIDVRDMRKHLNGRWLACGLAGLSADGLIEDVDRAHWKG